jgi:hypothetical protein
MELAEAEEIESDKPEEVKKPESDYNRFAVLLKGGLSFLNYTNDINQAINDLDPIIFQNFNELPNHSLIGLEGRYSLSQRWILKIGLSVENLLSSWTISLGNTVLFQEWNFERKYQFVNAYIGANYSLWQDVESYEIYIGADVGSTALNSQIIQKFIWLNGSISESDNTSSYSAFSWKLSFGGVYFLSSRFSVGLDLALKGGGNFNVSDQIPDTVQNEDTVGILYPEEINAAGMQIALYLGYHF